VRAAPKWKMRWIGRVSLWGGGGDSGGRKSTGEGHGGSVAGVDERQVTWPCMEESEGGKKEEASTAALGSF
jgi:hypothetical protein